jgi:hypothetical protein
MTFTPTITDTPTETPPGYTPPTPTATLPSEGVVSLVGKSVILDGDIYIPSGLIFAILDGAEIRFRVPLSNPYTAYVPAYGPGGGVIWNETRFGGGLDIARGEVLVDGALIVRGGEEGVVFGVVPVSTPTPAPTPTPVSIPIELRGLPVVEFVEEVSDFGILSASGEQIAPRALDVNADGSLDLLCGCVSGQLFVAISDAGTIDLQSFSEVTTATGESFSNYANGTLVPAFGDPDQDGDPDLFFGDGDWKL